MRASYPLLRLGTQRRLGAGFEDVGGSLLEPRRRITRLYTSYYKGELFPNQMVPRRQRLPSGLKPSQARKGVFAVSAPELALDTAPRNSAAKNVPADEAETEAVAWEAEQTDERGSALAVRGAEGVPRNNRPYVPLAEVAKLELQADYLTEGGLFQEALEFYGVVAKAYTAAYPEHHTQRIGILLKLGGAFRRTGRLESSLALIEKATASLDESANPSLELIVEALLELGLTKEVMGAADAAVPYEEAVTVVNMYHNFGESHRMLRLLPRLSRRFNLNFEQKFLYYSPFDYDRTFALVDQCLSRAEGCYRAAKDSEGVVRVLQQRKELIDKKFFNMRDFAGRIHTMRGHWMRRAGILTNAPTPDELLRFTPTVHQVFRDFKYELNAPMGRENEVQPGVNRTVMDMGNPYRRNGRVARKMLRDADYNFAKYVRNREFME